MSLRIIGGSVALLGAYILLTSFTRKKKLNLLFVGDSNTDNKNSYADKVKLAFPTYRVDKVAKWGEKTKWMLDNLETHLKGKKYDIITFLGGSNDVYGDIPLEETKSNILKINKLIKDNGAKSVIVTPPNKKFFPENDPVKNKKLLDLIEWEKKQDFDYLIDFHNLTDKVDLFASDLRHPNSEAHQILANLYIKTTGIS
jgi:lysophospholipase L1-like esterase